MEKNNNSFVNYAPCITMSFIVCATMLLNDTSISDSPVFESTSIWPYTISIIIISLTFCVVYFSLKLFKFQRICKQIQQKDESLARILYHKWSALRMTSIMLLCLVASIAFLVIQSISMWWCAVVIFVASFFCISSESKFQDIRQSLNKKIEE